MKNVLNENFINNAFRASKSYYLHNKNISFIVLNYVKYNINIRNVEQSEHKGKTVNILLIFLKIDVHYTNFSAQIE